MKYAQNRTDRLNTLRIVAIYALFSAFWIYLSDHVLGSLIRDTALLIRISVLKGFLFIIVTGALLYKLIFRYMQKSRQIEGELRLSQNLINALLEGTTDAIYVKDREGRYLLFNAAVTNFTGKTAKEVIGNNDTLLFSADDARVLMAVDRKIMDSGKVMTYEEELTVADDTARTFLTTKGPIFDATGEVRGLFGIARDITERKRAEADVVKLSEDMAARNLELEHANKEMESFIYSVSHDLRAPIRSMSGFAKIIVEDYLDKLDEQGRDYLNRILKSGVKSTQLIDDLLRLSQICRQDLDRIGVSLSNKASKGVEELREQNHGRNVEIVVKEGLTASVDPRLIELALSNLLGNAWKFTSKTVDARIEFGSFEKDGKTVYYVKDNGVGFDPTYTDKMFWPFHRLHSESEFEGTGIGLTIVERVIRRHGGRIWAEGEPGKGATVYFTLGE